MNAARAPGKLILAGEHAVVHGCPALVTAVNRHATVIVHPAEHRRDPRGDIDERYTAFRCGEAAIEQVVEDPMDLVYYATSSASPMPLRVEVLTDIPIGAGMGSSAAVLLAAIRAANSQLPPEEVGRLAQLAEDRQHGRSSGIDIHVCQHGGAWSRRAGAFAPIPLPLARLQVVHTGRPESSTGACVAAVATSHPPNDAVWSEFTECAASLARAFEPEAVREHQRLLERIGVVPQRVRDFVRDLESLGLAGKVCGAGAVRGEAAGMLLVIGGDLPPDLPARYGYETLDLEGEPDGLARLES